MKEGDKEKSKEEYDEIPGVPEGREEGRRKSYGIQDRSQLDKIPEEENVPERGERRRSSGTEMIRQGTRAFKKITRVLSHVYPHPRILTYKLEGITENINFDIDQRKKELLEKLYDLFNYDGRDGIDQVEWIELLKGRLNKDEKEIDFVEVVESIAYVVCGDSDVNFNSFSTIFRTKNVLNKLFRLIDRESCGVVSVEQVMDFISQLSSARSSSRLTKENIKWLEKLFRQSVGDGREIRKEDFGRIIQTKNQFFTDRVFDIFDRDNSGSISLSEFLDAMHQFASQDPDDKIRFLFKVYDVDGDGQIQEEELEEVMRACMEENGMKFSDDQIRIHNYLYQLDELTKALFEDADTEGRGALTYDALKAQLEKHAGLSENMSISIERWLVPPKPKHENFSLITKIRQLKPHQFSLRYVRNNYVYLIWLAGIIITNIVLFSTRFYARYSENPRQSWYFIVAKSCGQCLNFNATFIVVAMLRGTLTFLRSHGASSYVPIDYHIYFHKLTGWLIFIFGWGHAVMHMTNIGIGFQHEFQVPQYDVNPSNYTFVEILYDYHASDGSEGAIRLRGDVPTPLGLVPGYAFNTGVFLILILTIMAFCSLPFVRRGGCFEVFYWTHLLYTFFWILLIIHAPNYWKWFVVPGLIFIIEQILRYYHWRVGHGKTNISSGMLLPSKVTHLIIKRPPNFEFHPGDYVFARIPEIAKYEWHPFTISSAPEQSDVIWLHIRAVGQWTNRLYEYFENEQEKMRLSPGPNGGEFRARSETFITADRPKMNYSMADEVKGVKRTSHLSLMASSSGNSNSVKDITSSGETLNETCAIIKGEPIPLRFTHPKLTEAISLPNVTKRERDLNLRDTPMNRSHSVKDVESKPTRMPNDRPNSAAFSSRYMRNKPTVIALKTPSSEELDQMRSLIPKGKEECQFEKCLGFDMEAVGESRGGSFRALGEGTNISLDNLGPPLEIFVDGPYGAPSSHIFRAQHAVLIATGIGVTPFASILQSIMQRYLASRNQCPNCSHTWCAELPQSVLNLKKVDFFWINRDQRSFEWFVHLLSQLEIEQAELGGAMERFLDMHMYITSALQRNDMKAVGLQLALDLLHEKEKRDLITGLKTRTNAGRPNWHKIFEQLNKQQKGKITVFYCGPPALARTLKIKCDEFGFSFRKELF